MTHNNMEEQFSDIVRDFKLVTKHNGNLIVHLYNDPDAHPSAPQRQEHWREEERIDGGSQGTVWLQTCVRGSRHFTKRAVKKFLVGNRDSRLSYERELVAIVKFSHDRYSRYFVKSLGWYTSSSLLHIAMEYFPAGNLYTYVEEQQGLPEDECWQITSQVLSGIALMHEEGFAHRDLKPQNILIYERPPAQWWIKLADFGLSKNVITDPNNTDYALGTPGYIAPELYDADQRRCSTRDPQKPDIWALGVTALFILTNTVPFSGQDQTTQFAANRFPFPCAPLRSRNNELDSSLAASLDQGSYA
ncbi:CAMK protein kinase [Fusarium oxysporum f. sp. conglutinans race 2 54008]|nr:CAMK protein kinase [Fusarium oxysporum f. sp. conglutinans race 2 54008]